MKCILWSCLILLAACKSAPQTDEVKYNYSDDFKVYFKNTFDQDVKAGAEYFIVPLSSCGQCVDSALDRLAHDKYPWVVILSGQTEDSVRLSNIEIAKGSYVCFSDPTSMLSEYSVGIGLPTLLKTDNGGKIISKKEFHFGSWQEFTSRNPG